MLAQLRKKHGKTMQQVANAIGMTLSVYHRMEMASRMIQGGRDRGGRRILRDDRAAELIALFERRTADNLRQLKNGVPAEQLVAAGAPLAVEEDAKWGRLGALERYAMRRSIRYVGAPPEARPRCRFCGEMKSRARTAVHHFTIDLDAAVEQIPLRDLLRPSEKGFWSAISRSGSAC